MNAISGVHAYGPLPEAEVDPHTPQAAADKPTPAALTPLRRESVDQARARSGTDVVRDVGGSAKSAFESMKANAHKAKAAGVDAAKKTFWSKALGVAVAGLAMAAVISLTAATGGATLVAGAVIAGAVFAVSLADASCAYMNYRNAKAHERHEPPPHALPMGSNSIGNLIHWACKAGGASDGWARFNASLGSGILRMSMGVAVGICTMGASVAANSFAHITPMVAAASTILQGAVDILHSRSTSKVYVESVDELMMHAEKIENLLDNLDLSPEDSSILLDRLASEKAEAEKTGALVPALSRSVANAAQNGLVAGTALALLATGVDLQMGDVTISAPSYAKHAGGTSMGFAAQPKQPTGESAPLLRAEPSD